MLRHYRTPLIVMSPKSLLRHKDAVSTLEELAGRDVPERDRRKSRRSRRRTCKRVIACSGKIYYELVAHRRERKIRDVAIIRVEQQYPFPHDDFTATLANFPRAKEVVWCRRSRRTRARGTGCAPISAKMRCRSRWSPTRAGPVSASTAVGYMAKHAQQQQQLIEDAFGPKLADGEMLVAV